MAKKIFITIFSVLIVGVIAFCVIWTVINFDKVREGISGTGVYDKTDIDNAYEDGYAKALADKLAYETLINNYREQITGLNGDISELLAKITALNLDISLLDAIIEDYELANSNNQFIVMFVVNNRVHASQIVKVNESPLLPADPTKANYTFIGWSLIPEGEAIEVTTYPITSTTKLYPVFEKVLRTVINEKVFPRNGDLNSYSSFIAATSDYNAFEIEYTLNQDDIEAFMIFNNAGMENFRIDSAAVVDEEVYYLSFTSVIDYEEYYEGGNMHVFIRLMNGHLEYYLNDTLIESKTATLEIKNSYTLQFRNEVPVTLRYVKIY